MLHQKFQRHLLCSLLICSPGDRTQNFVLASLGSTVDSRYKPLNVILQIRHSVPVHDEYGDFYDPRLQDFVDTETHRQDR